MRFFIEQIAVYPRDPQAAKDLISEITEQERWFEDHVTAAGEVFGEVGSNEADLAFNYGLTPDEHKPLEFEVLHYTDGPNWMDDNKANVTPFRVSHLGMHCSDAELLEWRTFFSERGIEVAQEVMTKSHTNEAIAGKRWYNYVIFNTFPILGVDLKFIVRRNQK